MLGADLWLTGLSGAQSVGHCTNLWYPCPCRLLGKGRVTGWLIPWLTDELPGWLTYFPIAQENHWSNDDGVVEFPAAGQVPRSVNWQNMESHSLLHTCLLWRNCWFSVDLMLCSSSLSLVPPCRSMISWDRSVVLSQQRWNELTRLCGRAAKGSNSLFLSSAI